MIINGQCRSSKMAAALVVTTDMGASPEQVESDVTAPIESAMATTSNIKNISSVSYNSYSVVTLEYEQNANMDSVVIEIQQSLDQVSGQWDDSIGTPMIMKVNPDMMPVLAAAVDKDGMDANALSDYVKNDLAPALESLEGVASVTTTGQLEESVDVTLDQDKIDALNKKIQKKIDEQFEKSQKKIDAGKKKVESGKIVFKVLGRNGKHRISSYLCAKSCVSISVIVMCER